ncbi:MAG: hypothetical protein AB1352_05030 [Patescibacteria group bacterium]
MSTIVNVIYILLFLGMIVLPHFIVDDILFIPQAYAQSLGSLILISIGLLLYYLHQWDVRRMEKSWKYQRKSSMMPIPTLARSTAGCRSWRA